MKRDEFPSKLVIFTLGLGLCFCVRLGAADNQAYVIQFYKRFDKNSDGKLEPKEWKSSRASETVQRAIEDAGLNPEETVSLQRLIDARLKGSGGSKDDDKKKDRGYRPKIGQQRLDKDVPDWFRERDKNLDGQVAMAEYAEDWTDKLAEEFLKLDANQDGLITPEESLEGDEPADTRSSVASTRTSGSRYGRSSSSTSAKPTSEGTAGGETPSRSADDSKAATESKSGSEASAEGIPPAHLAYAKAILKKYDTSGDGMLTKDEWGEMSRDPSAADADSDGKISVVEYARWISSK